MDTHTDRILLQGMTFFGYHGAGPEERVLGQRFIVDLEVGADLAPAGRGDDLSQTLDYGLLYADTRTVLEGEPLNLIEAVAERVAQAALSYEQALWVRVRIRKPGVAIKGGILEAAAIEIFRSRQDGGASG